MNVKKVERTGVIDYHQNLFFFFLGLVLGDTRLSFSFHSLSVPLSSNMYNTKERVWTPEAKETKITERERNGGDYLNIFIFLLSEMKARARARPRLPPPLVPCWARAPLRMATYSFPCSASSPLPKPIPDSETSASPLHHFRGLL